MPRSMRIPLLLSSLDDFGGGIFNEDGNTTFVTRSSTVCDMPVGHGRTILQVIHS